MAAIEVKTRTFVISYREFKQEDVHPDDVIICDYCEERPAEWYSDDAVDGRCEECMKDLPAGRGIKCKRCRSNAVADGVCSRCGHIAAENDKEEKR